MLISAGPTYEAIDPVRFIGNHSSGKMGFALAEAFAENGADVILVAGPVNLQIKHQNIERVDVKSAEQMFDACHKYFSNADIAVMAAAVADYRPKNTSDKKIKKQDVDFTKIELKETKDILKSLGEIKNSFDTEKLLIGFALETDNEIENAKSKIIKKNADAIILNSMKDKGAGFGHDTNKISIIDNNFSIESFKLKSKQEIAFDIVNYIVKRFY